MSHSVYFVDTSALFKRYIQEDGTDEVDSIFEKAGSIVISNLTVVEVISNLKRLVDVERVISADVYNAIQSEFFKDIADARIRVEPVSSDVIIASLDLINKKYVTPIDSIQLATVLSLKESFSNISFVCSDRKLCRLAIDAGIKVCAVG